jgi:plasmid rolling circle replication initiator protein Rep
MVSTVLTEEEQEKNEKKIHNYRIEKYACQAVAKKALPNERVTICMSGVVGDRVEIWKHLKTDKTFYKGLMICGSIWTCPVCAAKISERRRNELRAAFTQHTKQGKHVAMLTLTFSHKRTDSLKTILSHFSDATSRFMSGKAFNQIRNEMSLIGRIKVYEVTYGKNGFHPHAHIALFYENEVDLESIQKRLFRLWSNACEKVGLKTNSKHGLDLQDSEHASAYLSKHGNWSLEQELSKAHIKVAKEGSMTPFDFLRNFLDTNDEKYLKLFREYAETFKGKRQIHWSRGLKDKFDIEEKTDEELAKEKIELADLLGNLSLDQWKEIMHLDRRAQLLNNIEKYGFDAGYSITVQ